MAGTSSSLVVKISADLNDFTRQLDKMTRDVDKAAHKVESVGKALTLGFTLPFVAMGAAIAKSAAEDEASIKKLEHTFGAATANMEGFIKSLMKTVPETDDALRQLTSTTDVFLRSVGFGVPKAVEMTKAVTTLAGDLAAFNHVSIDTAQGALQSALAGQTRGLKEFGIVISEADVKARAYKLGLAETGDELSHMATAQATWSLVLERTQLQQGEAARTIGEDANALARLKQSADAAADTFGAVFLPVAAKVVGAIAGILNGLAALPPATKNWVVGIGSLVAAVGPSIYIVGALAEKINALSKAIALLGAGSTLAGLAKLGAIGVITGLITLPILTAVLAFQQEGKAARQAAEDLDRYRAALDTLTAAQIKSQLSASRGLLSSLITQRDANKTAIEQSPPGTNLDPLIHKGNQLQTQIAAINGEVGALTDKLKALGATGGEGGGGGVEDVATAMKHIEERAKLIVESIKQMDAGWSVMPKIADAWADALRRADAIAQRFGDSLDPIAVTARSIVQDLRAAMGLGAPAALTPNLENFNRFGPGTPTQIPRNIMIGDVVPTPLDLSPLDSLPPIPQKLDTLHQALAAGFNQVAIAIGDTLASRLSAQLGGRGTGSAIGGQLGSAFGVGIGGGLGAAGVFGSGVLAAGVAGLATGGLAVAGIAIGSLIGGLFDHHKKSVDNSATALDHMSAAAERVAQSISNMPAFFKIFEYRFAAAPLIGTAPYHVPIPTTPPAPPSTFGTYGGVTTGTPSGNVVHVHGPITVMASNIQDLHRQLVDAAFRAKSTGAAATLQFAR